MEENLSDTNILNEWLVDLKAFANTHETKYKQATPFPSIYFDTFFNEEYLSKVLKEFPNLGENPDLKYNNPNEVKLASKGEKRFGPYTKRLMHFLNSEPFLLFLSDLTGIENLIPDPYFEGGGCHEIRPGGMLKIHADFNKHRLTGLDRRLNVLIYLNKDWDEKYGGHFELWDRDMLKAETKIAPLFNRLAIFSTTDFSYHGHPDPLNCPEDRSRKSLALYYYTNGRPEHEINQGLEDHTTLFVDRKGDKSENKMRAYNKVVNLAIDLMPPLLYRAIRNIRNK